MPFHIAIDGPVASGKGTVARLVAERLGLLYVDTGAMYRMTALLAIQQHIPFEDEEKIVAALRGSTMDLRMPTAEEKDGRLTTAILNNEDVSWKIRTQQVGAGASKVGALAKVREFLVEQQQKIAEHRDVVMEGRDITYRVFPHASMKIYLTASPEVRAQRRLLDLQIHGHDATFDQVYADLVERDKRDMSREADPLKIVDDAWVLDASHLNIEEVVEQIVARAIP